jgi:hypothetical protein
LAFVYSGFMTKALNARQCSKVRRYCGGYYQPSGGSLSLHATLNFVSDIICSMRSHLAAGNRHGGLKCAQSGIGQNDANLGTFDTVAYADVWTYRYGRCTPIVSYRIIRAHCPGKPVPLIGPR